MGFQPNDPGSRLNNGSGLQIPAAAPHNRYGVFLTGLNATISHQTMACPAMVMAVRFSPLIANNGTKYVRIDAEGMLAVFLGTWEFLFRTVGMLNSASPALPIEMRMSTKLTNSTSIV
jgi:hypothetical protein